MLRSSLLRRLEDLHNELAYLRGYATDLTFHERLVRRINCTISIRRVQVELAGSRA